MAELSAKSELRLALGLQLCLANRNYLPGRYSLVKFEMRELLAIENNGAMQRIEKAKEEYLKEYSADDLVQLEAQVRADYDEDVERALRAHG